MSAQQRPSGFDTGSHHIPDVDGTDWYGPDIHLRWLVRRAVGEGDWAKADSALRDAGTLVPREIEPRMVTLETNLPVLRQYDRRGQRVDEVDYHPCFREVDGLERRFGIVASRYGKQWRDFDGPAPVAVGLGAEYLFLQADQAIAGCATGMVSAMCRTLIRNDPALAAKWVPGLASDGDDYLTSAMFLLRVLPPQ